MKLVKDGKGKTGFWAGEGFDVENITARYPNITKQAEEKYSTLQGRVEEEVIKPLREEVVTGTFAGVIAEKILSQEEIIKRTVITITEVMIVSLAIEEVIEKGNISLEKALSKVELTGENEKEIFEKTSAVIGEELTKEVVSAQIIKMLFPSFD